MEQKQVLAWERSSHADDGQPLGLPARALLAIGKRLRPHKSGIPTNDEPFAEKYRHFFQFFPHTEGCAGDVIVEIGGGRGELAAFLARRAKLVYCVEPNPAWARDARERCVRMGNVSIVEAFGQDLPLDSSHADRVILHDVMEHVADPSAVLREARRVLKPGGVALVSFVPWYGPYGGHTWSFLPIPWLHTFYSRKVLAEMRSAKTGWHATDLGATGLYKISIADFLSHVKDAGFRVESLQFLGVRGQAWMTRVPLLREFGTSIVAASLVP